MTAVVALSFVHPAILGGLALASLPVIIHLLNRRRFKMMEWAAMDFLLQAAVRNRRRVRLENLLLLLLRTLMVLLLVGAVARPFSSRENALAGLLGGEGATERLILLDDSHSMRAGQGNQGAFDSAKQAIRRLVERLHDERSPDAVTLVLGSRPRGGDDLFARVAVASANARRMLDRLDELRPSDGSLDLVGALDALLENAVPEGSRVLLHIVSDFRRRDWSDADGTMRPDVREALARFAEAGEVRLLDVGAAAVQNVGVTALEARDRAVVLGVPATFVATVRNHGPDRVANPQVTFSFGGQALVPERIEATLEPGEERQVAKEFTFRDEGPAVVSARTLTDVLPGDDERRLVVEVRRTMRFLLVDGEPAPEDFRGETDFLAAALAPPGDVSSGIAVDPVADLAFSGRELDGYDGVFLCNVYRLPEERLAKLEEYVRGGGGLVMFLGDQVDPAIYNATFHGRGAEAGKRLLPVALLDVEGSSDGYVHLAAPAADHPVVRFLRGMNEIVFRTVSVRHWIAVRPPQEAEAKVLLSYADDAGSPALVEKGFGEGRVLLFTTAADLEWSNFPHSILYLALLQECARYVVRPDAGDRTRLVDEALSIDFDPARMQRVASLLPPAEAGGAPVQLSLAEDKARGKLAFRYDRTGTAGVYTFRLKSPAGEEFREPRACNIDPTEGDLRRADLARVAAALPGLRVERAGDENALDAGEGDRTEFWRTILYALLLCAALESVLAWRFGHHAAARAEEGGKQVFVR